jgi:nucleotide-binding universal stress UspA family protein
MKTILVGYDGTEPAEQALRRATELARPFKAKVVVVSVAPPHPLAHVLRQTGAREFPRSRRRVPTYPDRQSRCENRGVPVLRAAALALLLLVGGAAGAPAARRCRVVVVEPGRSIEAAVLRAKPCDWVLVAPGVYHGSVTIRTPELHLRGLDRNRVVLDGRHRAANGIEVAAGGVTIENLTVRNFDRRGVNDEETGNELLWRDVHGWSARWVTAYDTGLLGGYGFWAGGSTDGSLTHVYASGFNDSGLYVGSCRDCRTAIVDSVAERNADGLAATNAGGRLTIEHSTFRSNAVGASLNSSASDPPPPQLGSCGAAPPTTTRLSRCTVFRGNRVVGNDALTVPANTSSIHPGWGIGIALLGAQGDLIANNVIAGNANIGVLGIALKRFRLAGNRIANNRISGSHIAIALTGGPDNCITAPGPLSCAHLTTSSPPAGRVRALVARLHREFVSHARRGQPAPQPLPTMPRPCSTFR